MTEPTAARDKASESQTLRAMGLDALADMPKGLRRNFTPGAVIAIATTLVGASVTCAYFFADAKAARLHEAQLTADHAADHQVLEAIKTAIAVGTATTNLRLKSLEDEAVEQKAWRERARGAWEVPTKQVMPAKVIPPPARRHK